MKAIFLTILLWGINANCTSYSQHENLITNSTVEGNIAFTHVNLISMDSDALLSNQTVIIQNGLITEIGSVDKILIPNGYFIIDGKGNSFLMPGLTDMHTHVWYEEDLLPYVANGVTTILNMGSPSSILDYRKKSAGKEIIAPYIFASGFVDGPNSQGWLARTPAEAEEAVAEIKSGGWDFIKAYNSIPLDAYETMMVKAREEEIAVIGHGVRAPGLEGILKAGQVMIAHAEEYLYTYFNNTVDDTKIDLAVKLTKDAGAYVTPNLCTYETISKLWGNPSELIRLKNLPEMKFVNPKWKDQFWQQFDFTSRGGSISNQYNFLKKLTKALHDNDVPLLIGTDTPYVVGQANGFAIHDDFRNLIDSGLSTFEALAAGTKTPGEFINKFVPKSQPFGLVKVGYRADLLLLQSNPLVNIAALKNRIGVMINGRWITEQGLQIEMKKLSETF